MNSGIIRSPAVAGRFYPEEPAPLRRQIEQFVSPGRPAAPARAIVVPHAGYIYSGAVAGAVYASVALPGRFVLLCPNHTGLGSRLAVQSRGLWQTPLGLAAIDEQLAAVILASSPLFQDDARAHAQEHALEVHLPFLQQLREDFRFVPVCVGDLSLDQLLEVGTALAGVLREWPHDVLLIASSDMSHYVPQAVAQAQDAKAIEAMLRVDAAGLFRIVQSERISMCGYAPTTIVLATARALGATEGELVRYATSGETSGDFERVVGYAGLVVR